MKNTKNIKKGSIYIKSVLVRKIYVEFKHVDNYLKEHMLARLKEEYEGKCSKEGFIRQNSISLLSYSSGLCEGSEVKFIVTFKCLICMPVVGMKIKVKVLNKTKAGIRGSSRDPMSPIDVFVTRDHNIHLDVYKKLEIDDIFTVKIIGHRFEINDTRISIIADICENENDTNLILLQ